MRGFGCAEDERLNRHAERREQAIPTVSVLAGPREYARAVWRHWLTRSGRTEVACSFTAEKAVQTALMRAWLEVLCRAPAARLQAMLAHIDRAAGMTTPMSAERLQRMSDIEQSDWLREAHVRGVRPIALAVCRWLVACVRASDARAHADARLHDELQRVGEPAWVPLIADTHTLWSARMRPALTLLPPTDAEVESLERAFSTMYQLVEREPLVCAAVIVTDACIDAYLAGSAESRNKAMVRQSLVRVQVAGRDATLSKDAIGAQVATPTDRVDAQRSRSYLALVGADAEVMAAVDEAEARHAQPALASDDGARSAAERLLFQTLAAHEETAGLFALNRRIDIRFGTAPMEIDLSCLRLGIAIEIDGYYHFTDADAYRRDRRKDVLLQTHGFLVLRFLAVDVVTAIDLVVDTVVHAVNIRNNQGGGHI